MRVRLHPEAETEMIEAAAYYEDQQADLGKRFLASVQDAINSIRINPRLYPVVDLDVRRCLTKVFPFVVCPSGDAGRILYLVVRILPAGGIRDTRYQIRGTRR
jgi:toxin ParE1/3/4